MRISTIIIYSLSVAYVCKTMLVPFIINSYLKYYLKRFTLKNQDENGFVSDWKEFNDKASRIRKATYKPFNCIKCMSFWCSLIISICAGFKLEAAFVGIVGLAAGMLLEGIMMRYL